MTDPTTRRRGNDLRDLSLRSVVDAIRPKAERYFVWDANVPGFGIDVRAGGTRTWVLFYRVLGVQRRVRIGRVDTMPYAIAEKKVRAYLTAIDNDRDPFLEREATVRSASVTFADVAEGYLRTLEQKRSKRWHEEAGRILRRDLLPTLGKVPISKLAADQVRALHEGMADRPFLANRAKAIVSAVVERAIEDGSRPTTLANPAAVVEDYPEPERDRVVTGDEWKRLRSAIRSLRAELADAPEHDTRAAQLRAVELLALCGARLGAVLPRTYADLNLDAGVLRVVPTHKYVSRIILGAAARRLVAESLPDRPAPRDYLFPGQDRRVGARTVRGDRDTRKHRDPAPIGDVRTAWRRLVELAALDDFTPHDLRGTFASIGAELGYSTFVIGGLLGHRAQGITEKHYAQRPDSLLLAAADAISEEIAKRLGLAQPSPKREAK